MLIHSGAVSGGVTGVEQSGTTGCRRGGVLGWMNQSHVDGSTVSVKAHLGNPGFVQTLVVVLIGLQQEALGSCYPRYRWPVLWDEIAVSVVSLSSTTATR
jgi:hypothetical protein